MADGTLGIDPRRTTDHRYGADQRRDVRPHRGILTPNEARAHAQLLHLIQQRRAAKRARGLPPPQREARREWLSRQMDQYLVAFATRCNCGATLVSTPKHGRTDWRCICGWKGSTWT